jgi:hypothetical protein
VLLSDRRSRRAPVITACALLVLESLALAAPFALGADAPAAPPASTSDSTTLNETTAGGTEYALLGPAVTYHQQATQAGRRYNWVNWGLGVERRQDFRFAPAWQERLTASVNEDSFRHLSAFVATELLHPILTTSLATVRLGPALGVAYKYMQWEGPYEWVPLLGPVLAIDPNGRGVAVELNYLYHRNERVHDVNGLATLRLVYRFGPPRHAP